MVIKKWRSYLFHPLIIGFSLSLLVIFILSRYLPQYYTELVEEVELTNNGEIYYFDLDNDGNSEKINYHHYDRIFKPTLYLYDSKNNFKSLWSFFESPLKNSNIFAGDFNNDNYKEIFVFTENSDSLFLYILDYTNDKEAYCSRKFITNVGGKGSDVRVTPIGLYDLNKGNGKEFLFAIDAGYPSTPCRIYSFDITNDKINNSPEINANISKPIIIEDINADGLSEIIVSNRSVDVKGNGSSAKLIVLNNELKYLFQPIIFQGELSQVTVKTIDSGKEKLVAVLHSGTKVENVFNSLMLYNYKGERIKEVNIENKSNLLLTCISDHENKIYLFNGNKIYRYTSELVKDKVFTILKGKKMKCIQRLDITGDSKKEMVFRGDESIIIASENLKHKVKLKLPDSGKLNITLVSHKLKPNQISIQTGANWYLFDFYKNEAFFYSSIFYFLVFIIITFLSFLISKVRLKILVIKKSFHNRIENNLISKLEKNIEEEKPGIRSEINEIINDDERYSIYNSDEEREEPKLIFSEKKLETDFKNRLSNLIFDKEENLNFSFQLPDDNFLETVNSEIKDIILEFIKSCFDFIAHYSKNRDGVLQIIPKDGSLNILIEIENVFIDSSEFDRNEELSSIIEKANGSLFVDNFSGFGTIINANFSLNLSQTEIKKETNKIRIIIAEDHDVSLFGLVSLFKTKDDIEIVGTAKNGMEVLKLLETIKTDIVITDISMPGMDGIELSEKLKNEYPTIKVIVFTMYLENWFVEQLVANGAKGFVSKNSKIIELIGAVRNVYEGSNYYCPQFKSKFGLKGNNNGITKKLDSLTKNELYIIKQYSENLSKEQIAEKMNLNTKTIEAFVANILLKLNAGDEDEIIRIAKKQKFITE